MLIDEWSKKAELPLLLSSVLLWFFLLVNTINTHIHTLISPISRSKIIYNFFSYLATITTSFAILRIYLFKWIRRSIFFLKFRLCSLLETRALCRQRLLIRKQINIPYFCVIIITIIYIYIPSFFFFFWKAGFIYRRCRFPELRSKQILREPLTTALPGVRERTIFV